MSTDKLKPIHPGEVLLEEFLKPMQISEEQLAIAVNVPVEHVRDVVCEKQRVVADMALRLGRYFGISPRFWMGLQMDYDLDTAEDKLGELLEKEVTVLSR